MAANRFPARLVFPVEANDSPSFRALYEQMRPLGEERYNAKTAELTFLHPGTRGGRLDSLERLLINVGLPYNLYCDSESGETLHYWRPGMRASASTDRAVTEGLRNPGFILSVRRACEELVYGQTAMVLSR
jgi:hypothetical protein